jgi:hypothetical protein
MLLIKKVANVSTTACRKECAPIGWLAPGLITFSGVVRRS